MYTSPSCLALCAVGRKTLFIEVPCNQAAVDSAMYVCVCSRQDQLNGSTQIGSGSPSHTRDRKSKSCVNQTSLCKGFRTSDPQRNATGQSTERSPLVSMLFSDIPKSLEIFNEHFQYSSTPCILDKQ